jgi:hypothetical protein
MRVRLPFSMDGEVGLGDAVKRVASSVHIPTCGGCERRAAALNRRVVCSPDGDATPLLMAHGPYG